MYQQILVPLDTSSRAEAVVPHVVELAKKFSSQVILLHSSKPLELLRKELLGGDLSALQMDVVTDIARRQVEAHHEFAERYLRQQVNNLQAAGVDVRSGIVEGEPSEAIVRYAREQGSSLIAMATHGRGGLSRLVYGSVADRVVRSAPCPVLIVRSVEHSEET